jgi:hypothetical protein
VTGRWFLPGTPGFLHQPIISFVEYIDIVWLKRTAYRSGAPEFTSGFSGVRVDRSLIFYIVFCTSLFVLFHLAIVLSVVRFKVIIASVIINFQTFLARYSSGSSEVHIWCGCLE